MKATGDLQCDWCHMYHINDSHNSRRMDLDMLRQLVEASKRLLSKSELPDGRSGNGLARGLGSLAEHLGRLVAANTSTPLSALLLVFVRAGKGCQQKSQQFLQKIWTDKFALAALTSVASSLWSSLLTSWSTNTVAVFL
jgi:hypothetical protein